MLGSETLQCRPKALVYLHRRMDSGAPSTSRHWSKVPRTKPTGWSWQKGVAARVHGLQLNVTVAVANHRLIVHKEAQQAGPEVKAPRRGTLLLFDGSKVSSHTLSGSKILWATVSSYSSHPQDVSPLSLSFSPLTSCTLLLLPSAVDMSCFGQPTIHLPFFY